jgi:hypothetical protein
VTAGELMPSAPDKIIEKINRLSGRARASLSANGEGRVTVAGRISFQDIIGSRSGATALCC